jgi:UDP-N-acetylglucosamine 1-carboxyvinyltransferase
VEKNHLCEGRKLMDTYVVKGKKPLMGSVSVHGSKNSVLPILAATILARGESVIHNCPALRDVFAMAEILECLGCRVSYQEGSMTVDASELTRCAISDCLMQEMRASVLFLGPLLARTGEAEICYPGGCALGPRPIDLHIKALRELGAETTDRDGRLICRAGRLTGRKIVLDLPSVGATENAMLAAVGAVGTTVICNAAREPEIVDLQEFLKSMGAKVWGAGGSTVVVEGGAPLHPGEYTVMSDRIVTATYLAAVASAGGEMELLGADYRTVAPVIAALMEAGCAIQSMGNRIWIQSHEPLRGIRPIYTAPYPGFPTDAQPVLMAALAGGAGKTEFVETIFENRYSHVEGLCRMGADIRVDGIRATVRGCALQGAKVEAYDLRGGAALVVAALGADGESSIGGLGYIDRGYEALEDTLHSLGADIIRFRESDTCGMEDLGQELDAFEPLKVAGGAG